MTVSSALPSSAQTTEKLVVPQDLVSFANTLADTAREVVPRYFRLPIGIDLKTDESPVTIADRETEAAMMKLIQTHYPSHDILGEEYGLKRGQTSNNNGILATDPGSVDLSVGEWTWVLDPIDGTTSFITGKPVFGVLIALLHYGRPVLGVIEQPISKERWVGVHGVGTTFNGEIVSTRTCNTLKDAYLYTTSPHLFPGASDSAFTALRTSVRRAQYGCDCYAFGLLALGHVDIVMEFGIKPWDYMALVPVVEGAGGVITDWLGRSLTLTSMHKDEWVGHVLACGDEKTHGLALETLEWQQRQS